MRTFEVAGTTLLREGLRVVRRAGGLHYRRYLRPFLVEANAGPDAMIIGVQKCATTFLSHLLTQHPQILGPKIKELHYFDDFYSFGDRWYRSNFAGQKRGREILARRGETAGIRYDATPDYVYHPLGAQRMHAFRPDLRLIIILRDPVSRAVSQYQHMQRAGLEARPIDIAIQSDRFSASSRLDAELTWEEKFHSYVDRGIYYPQIERLLRYFHREQLLILFFDDVTGATQEILGTVCSFLGIGTPQVSDTRPQNVGSGASISEKTRQYIKERTAPSDERLWRDLDLPRRW